MEPTKKLLLDKGTARDKKGVFAIVALHTDGYPLALVGPFFTFGDATDHIDEVAAEFHRRYPKVDPMGIAVVEGSVEAISGQGSPQGLVS